jgi:xanthine dehydrogenase small subunit
VSIVALSAMSRDSIHFLLNGRAVTLWDVAPTRSLLAWLREERHLTGSKEGCAEGDCGACTVVIGERLANGAGELRLRPVNACIQWLPAVDGKALFTVEFLRRQADGRLHPAQQAMVDCHGSQCGYCTPGFVMSLWSAYHSHSEPLPETELRSALAGNLCRCTGYRPILEAGRRMFELPPLPLDQAGLATQLAALPVAEPLTCRHASGCFHAPTSLADLLELKATHPEAIVLAGGTDVGLWTTKELRDLGDVLYLGRVTELQRIEETAEALTIGAAASLTDAFAALLAPYPELAELAERFGSQPIRNAGTLGGNVANGSPIGDTMPALMALGARLALASRRGERELALEDFYLDYMKKDLASDEILRAIVVPKPRPGLVFRAWKLAKRHDSDISALCGAFALDLDDGRIVAARVAYGGMAATVRRAPRTEAALTGAPWNEATARAAMAALDQDYAPLSDHRASAAYRRRAAANLLYRCFLETRPDAPLPPQALHVHA